jgi:hypothetical protein
MGRILTRGFAQGLKHCSIWAVFGTAKDAAEKLLMSRVLKQGTTSVVPQDADNKRWASAPA